MGHCAATVVLGGGFSGLAAAWCLARGGRPVTVLERAPRLGGLASAHPGIGFPVERFYHHLFPHDDALLALLPRFGAGDRILWRDVSMGFVTDGRLWPFTTPLDLLLLGALSPADRVRFGLFAARVRRQYSYADLDVMGAEEWLRRETGEAVYRRLLEPLLRVKFGAALGEVSAAFVLGRLQARSGTRRGLWGKERLGYPRGGFQALADDLGEAVRGDGGRVLTGEEVIAVEVAGGRRFRVRTASGLVVESSDLVSTLPAPVIAGLLSGADPLRRALGRFRYRAAVCLAAGLEESVSPHYWINQASDRAPFGVLVEQMHLVPAADCGGGPLVYLGTYADPGLGLSTMHDERVRDLFLEGLDRLFPAGSPRRATWWQVAREPHATPVFHRGYAADLEAARRAQPPGFRLAGTLTVYPGSRNVSAAVAGGLRAAEELLGGA